MLFVRNEMVIIVISIIIYHNLTIFCLTLNLYIFDKILSLTKTKILLDFHFVQIIYLIAHKLPLGIHSLRILLIFKYLEEISSITNWRLSIVN